MLLLYHRKKCKNSILHINNCLKKEIVILSATPNKKLDTCEQKMFCYIEFKVLKIYF